MTQPVTLPTADEQVRFLRNIQRLLEETRTTSTYKYALLLALADLSIEHGDDSGTTLRLTTRQVAAKFATYYWQQTLPFETASGKVLLRQNTDRPPRVLTDLARARATMGDSLSAVLANKRLLSRIDQTVRNMPLRRLQKMGKSTFDFLYAIETQRRSIELRAGIGFCFRRFHGLIQDLVRGAWLRFVRELNGSELGTKIDLWEFLFGSKRGNLAAARQALEEVGPRRCFFCGREVATGLQLDHFIPWSRYAIDLGHNFVLSDIACNSAKGDRLPSLPHLQRWAERNTLLAADLERSFVRYGVLHDPSVTLRVAAWAYAETEAVEGLTWDRADIMVPLGSGWRRFLDLPG